MSLLESKNILILGIIAFLVMSFWSLYSMSFDMNGKMVNCPFMNGLPIFCQMNLNEHINQWQQFFTVIREKSLLLSTLLVFAFIALSNIEKTYNKLKFQRFRNYSYQHKPEIKLFDYLLIAFSQGIIHSKIYA